MRLGYECVNGEPVEQNYEIKLHLEAEEFHSN